MRSPRASRKKPAATRLGGIAIACLIMAATPAAATASPSLSAPKDVEQGKAIGLSIDPNGARGCVLATRNPQGNLHTRRIRGGSPYALDARVRGSAATGRWKLALRCRGHRATVVRRLRVNGFNLDGGMRLLTKARVTKLGRTPITRLSHRNQLARSGPQIEELSYDGLGAGDRSHGAIAWALNRQGDSSYNFWCLRFVANAFGAANSGWPTAQAAADALGVRDRGAGPGAAPRGSLVFFHYRSGGTNYGHVGISLGDGRMVHAVATVRVESMNSWAKTYLGWAYPPAHWPGRFVPPSQPPTASPQPTPAQPKAPSAAPRRVIAIDNRVTNGMGMREDPTPVRLTTKPWKLCGSRGCNINGTERVSGGTYDAAICQTFGERTTNGHDTSPADDANPLRFESTRYYGVRLSNGTFGYVSEVWIRSADRGGLGLPAC